MKIRQFAILLLLLGCASRCFAGGLKGPLIDDQTLYLIIFLIILLHVLSVAAYFLAQTWLRVLCGLLYIPLIAIPFLLMFLHGGFVVLMLPMIAFYYFTLVRKRKKTGTGK